MGDRRDGFYGEVRLVGVPGWTGDNRIWISKCSTANELARGIDAVLFFSGEKPHYFNYPEGHFETGELKIAKETETTKSFFGRMTKKYSKKNGVLTIRTPISPPISGPASASYTAEESATAEPEGDFDPSELEIAEETETSKSFPWRMVKKSFEKDGVLTIRTPISPPTSGPASAFYTAEESATPEESEDNANAHRNPTIAESSQSLQAPQPPIASAQKTADKYIPTDEIDYDVMQFLLCSEDQAPSRDGGESHRLPGFSTVLNSTAMPGAQNHSPGVTPSNDKLLGYETFEIPPWVEKQMVGCNQHT
jgi:hypothetical protein